MLKCFYQDCDAVKKTSNDESLFKLPNDYRRQVWLKHASATTMKESAYPFAYLCQKHFFRRDIIEQGSKKYLNKHAIPVSSPSICECTESTTDNLCSVLMYQWRPAKDQPETTKYLPRFAQNNNTNLNTAARPSNKTVDVSSVSSCPSKLSDQELRKLLDDRFMSDVDKDVKSLILAQIFQKSPLWKTDEKELYIKFQQKFPECYRAMCAAGFKLPSESLIQKWKSEVWLSAGLSGNILKRLTEKANNFTPLNRKCVLFFYELSLKRKLEYSGENDIINGFVDFGELGRTNMVASKAIVFTLRGVNRTWKEGVCYYIGSPSSEQLTQIVRTVILEIIKCGYTIVATLCDLTPENVDVYNNLSVLQNPLMEIEDQKIFLLYDHHNLYKCIRNILFDYDIHIGKDVVNWDIFWSLYDHETEIFEIDEQLVKPSNKNSIKYAIELLSDDVAAVIQKAISNNMFKNLKTKEVAEATAKFCRRMNELFKILNSGQLCTSNVNGQFVVKSRKIIDFLNNTRRWIAHWRTKNKTTKAIQVPYCFKALQQTILAIEMMWEHLLAKVNDQQYLFLENLHLDWSENILAKMRWDGYALDQNLTVSKLMRHLKRMMFPNVVSAKRPADFDDDDDDDDDDDVEEINNVFHELEDNHDVETKNLKIKHPLAAKFLKFKLECSVELLCNEQMSEEMIQSPDDFEMLGVPDDRFNLTCVSFYAGFIAWKIKPKLNNCKGCIQFLVDDNPQRRKNLVSRFQTYATSELESLPIEHEIPTEQFVKIVLRVQQIFITKVAALQIEKDIILSWLPEIMKELKDDLAKRRCASDEHKEIIIKDILTGIFLYTIKNTNRELKKDQRSKLVNVL